MTPRASGVNLCWAARLKYRSGYYTHYHRHSWWQSLYVVEGSMAAKINGTIYTLEPAHCVILGPYVQHALLAAETAETLEAKFLVDEDWLNGDIQSLGMPVFKYLKAGQSKLLERLVEEGQECKCYYKELADLYLAQFLVLIARDLSESPSKLETVETAINYDHLANNDRPNAQNVLRIITYMEEHLPERLTLPALSRYIGYTTQYLCQMFARVVGVPPMGYLANLRFHKAQELLLTTDHSVTEISNMVGFSSLPSFYRVFKARSGMSPGAFRAQHGRKKGIVVAFMEDWREVERTDTHKQMALGYWTEPNFDNRSADRP